MNLLLLHMRYAPDATGTGPLVTQLAEDLVRAGHQVRVITTVPHYGRAELPSDYEFGLVFREERNGVELLRTMAFPWAGNKVWGRGLDYGLYTLFASALGMVGGRPDLVLCVSPPITVGFPAWLVKRLYGVPVVFNAQDIWPDGLVEMGRLQSEGVVSLFHAFERWIYRIADRVTVVSAGMKENLLKKGVPEGKVVVVPNWVDLEAVVPLGQDESFRAEWDLDGRFVVLFAGNLGYASSLEFVVETAGMMRGEEDIHFLFVGQGSAKEALLRQCRGLGLDNVSFRPTQAEEDLSRVLATSDVSLVTLRAGMGQLSVPSKTFAYMASGRPIIASVPRDSEIRRLLEGTGTGWLIPPEDPAALAEAIVEAREMGPELRRMGDRGRHLVELDFDRQHVIGRIRELLGEMASSSATSSQVRPPIGDS